MTIEEISNWFMGLQDDICRQISDVDGKSSFIEDKWEREGGGDGRSRVIADGNIIEKGGVNFSAVHGAIPGNLLKSFGLEGGNFYATGVSIVMHPKSPMVPIIHMNVRYFEMDNGVKWFGGGIDLTPHYIFKDDAVFFHKSLKNTCDKHHHEYYPEFKRWADDYFFIKHRNETRGIGGIFFDRLSETSEISLNERFDFVKDIGNSFAPIYTHLMKKNANIPYSESDIAWQLFRRSRYVEFNLVYDVGTKFGLETNGRIESILMSLPPSTGWIYGYENNIGTKEKETLGLLVKDIDWINQ